MELLTKLIPVTVCVVGLVACSPFHSISPSGVEMSSGIPAPGASSIYEPADASGKPFRYVCAAGAQQPSGDGQVRRLSKKELSATLQDLLGSKILAQLEIELLAIPADTMTDSVAEFTPFHTSAHATAYLDLALKASNLIVSDTGEAARLLGACVSTAPIADTCFQQMLSQFGLRVLRRPLEPADAASYLTDFKAAGSGPVAMRETLARLLLSPDFLFHVEGSRPAVSGRVRLTDFEVASRISYRLTGSMPDSLLLDAAAKGELQNLENVRAQTNRLLKTTSGKAQVDRFFSFWMKLDHLSALTFGPHFTGGMDTDGLREEMAEEALDFTRYILWVQEGKYHDLLTSTAVFPRTQRLAQIYKSQVTNSIQAPVNAGDGRAGLLMRAAMLVSSHEKTSPIIRGVSLRKRILCDPLVPPNEEIIASRTKELGSLDRKVFSNRQIVAKITEPTNCMGCHQSINPLGFVLEGFDSLGRRQSQETVFDETGAIVAVHPIDTRVENANIEPGALSALAEPAKLAYAIVEGVKGPACMTAQLFRFSRIRMGDSTDTCQLAEMERLIRRSNGNLVDLFISNVANEGIFWKSAN